MKCKETIRAMNSMMLKRKRTNLILSLSVAMLIFIASSSTRRVEGFKATSSQPIHQNITREALSFLKNKAVLEDIVGKQQPLDERTQATPSWHFDAGYFRESIDRINGHYKSAVVAIGQGNYSSAAKYFGELLHPLQDFYAHTNWVELEAMKLVGGGLFDSGKSYWWRPERDWQVHPERFTMVVAQGEKGSMPSGWKASYLSGGRGATPKDRIMQIATIEYTY